VRACTPWRPAFVVPSQAESYTRSAASALPRPRGKLIKDTIRSLRTNGLVNQTSDGYMFATRAAFRMVQIVGRVN
jgi:hypothetical protein